MTERDDRETPDPAQRGLMRWPRISLRDWFAGQAMPAVHAAAVIIAQNGRGTMRPDEIAEEAYQIADAMLAERDKP